MTGLAGLDADTKTAKEAAIRLLARREHSRLELTQKLKKRGWDESLCSKVLDNLAELGLQSEERFAQSFARARFSRGQGPVKIQAELAQRGIAKPLAAAACNQQELDWVAQCRRIYRRKFGSKPVSDYGQRAKRYRFLAQRGFTRDHIDAILSSRS